ncbi:N-terminal part of molybdate metabolism regulator MolR-like protein [Escherichia coli]|uniref:N-terminal part of molybdate metabolism regulator MolR-like protein n=1 Tax=Escherichia coli TaxID=562 RepID=A0A2X3JKB5_ECOLX|nr:N-terminal part of molybdate metabolism regulator MolR-like protein [Escherichia coli]
MDKELPWLADNAQLELKYKKGKTPLQPSQLAGRTSTCYH